MEKDFQIINIKVLTGVMVRKFKGIYMYMYMQYKRYTYPSLDLWVWSEFIFTPKKTADSHDKQVCSLSLHMHVPQDRFEFIKANL